MPLVFPGSSRKKADAPLDPYEMTFRDGKRTVPPHLMDLMSDIDTVRYTYSDAIGMANQRIARDHVSRLFDGIVTAHFREPGR